MKFYNEEMKTFLYIFFLGGSIMHTKFISFALAFLNSIVVLLLNL